MRQANEIALAGDEIEENIEEHGSETILEFFRKEVIDEYESVKNQFFEMKGS